MKQITWEINCLSTPHITRYCKKCKTKAEFQSSGAFRVNAQKKTIDVWLIYKCINCDSTWNMTIYTRITPGSIPAHILDGFHCNDPRLAAEYANHYDLLQKNGVDLCTPDYVITGEDIPAGIPVELTIKAASWLPVKLTRLLRQKMRLSQAEILKLYQEGVFQLPDGRDFNRIRMKEDVTMIIHLPN